MSVGRFATIWLSGGSEVFELQSSELNLRVSQSRRGGFNQNAGRINSPLPKLRPELTLAPLFARRIPDKTASVPGSKYQSSVGANLFAHRGWLQLSDREQARSYERWRWRWRWSGGGSDQSQPSAASTESLIDPGVRENRGVGRGGMQDVGWITLHRSAVEPHCRFGGWIKRHPPYGVGESGESIV